MQEKLKILLPHVMALVVFVIISVSYFFPQLQGKVIKSSDSIQYTSMSREVRVFEKETGETALWTNSMFGGMPTFQLTAPQKNNWVKYIAKVLKLGFDKPIGYFILGMLSFYIAVVALGMSPIIGIIGGILFAFSTGNIILYDTGHITKLQTVLLSPPVLAGVILVFRDKLLKGGILFTLFLSLCIMSNHPQMVYYLAIVIGIYVLIETFQQIKEKKFSSLGKKIGILALGAMLSLGSSASKLWTTYEYGKSTMRGKPILTNTDGATNSSSSKDGLDWDYAMNWSNGVEDLFVTYIPMLVGGSTQEILSNDSELVRKVPQLRNQPVPLYWGGLVSTSGPYYFGAVVFLFFLFGGIVVRGRLKWFLVVGVIITFLISLGKNFEMLNRLLFDYLPLYNKFRTPNSVLSVTGTFMTLLAILGINELVKSEDHQKFVRPLLISAGSLVGLAAIFVLAGSSLFSFEGTYDSGFASIIDLLRDERVSVMKSSSLRSIGFIALSMGIVYLYIKRKIKKYMMVGLIGVIALLDLWVINMRYLNYSEFETKRKLQQEFQPRPVDQQILADPDIYYRVFDVQNFSVADISYHHKTIGGYHPAKLQRFQDIIDYHLSKNNQAVLNMLNTKYIIIPTDNNQYQAQVNPGALGNAWFVRKVEMVENADAEINALTGLQPDQKAILNAEFSDYLSGSDTFSGNGNIKLTKYGLNELTYSSSSQDPQFAVFSEIWYQPGWNAYIDGNKVDHVRVNYILRGLYIPAGDHAIIFKFEPKSYYLGEKISLFSSLLIIFGLFYLVFQYYKSNF